MTCLLSSNDHGDEHLAFSADFLLFIFLHPCMINPTISRAATWYPGLDMLPKILPLVAWRGSALRRHGHFWVGMMISNRGPFSEKKCLSLFFLWTDLGTLQYWVRHGWLVYCSFFGRDYLAWTTWVSKIGHVYHTGSPKQVIWKSFLQIGMVFTSCSLAEVVVF